MKSIASIASIGRGARMKDGIVGLTEFLLRLVQPDSRASTLADLRDVLDSAHASTKARRVSSTFGAADDPVIAIDAIIRPRLRPECRREFAALLRRLQDAALTA